MPFRRNDREFTERLFRNARQQEATGGLIPESLREYLIDPRSREVFPIQIDNVSVQINEHGFPTSTREKGIVVLDCGHKPCSLSQVQGRCGYGHLICDKCTMYTCEICGQKLCDLDVLKLEDGTTVCIDHEGELRRLERRDMIVRGVGHTLLYLCGWSGPQEDE